MAYVIYAKIVTACEPDAAPSDLVERCSAEGLLDRHCKNEVIPKKAQELLLWPVVSTAEEMGDAMGEAKRVIQSRLAAHYPVTFEGGAPEYVKWVPTQTGHQTIGRALNSSLAPITFEASDETSGKTYTGTVLFAFEVIGASPTE